MFREPKKNAGISERPFHGDYQERLATRSLETETEQAKPLQGHLEVNLTREDILRHKREQVWCEHCSHLRAAGTTLKILTLVGLDHALITFRQRRKTPKLLPNNGNR